MRLQVGNRIFLQKLFQVFTEMTVVVITILFITKLRWIAGQLLYRFADAQDLKCFFGTETGGGFKISVEGALGNMVLFGECFHRSSEIIVYIAVPDNF